MLVAADNIRAQIAAILAAWGMPAELIATTAQVMVDTDLAGVDSHGISMLMTYEDMWRRGQVKLAARPQLAQDFGATAVIDAGDGLGHPAGRAGMELAIAKARAFGVGAVAVRNSSHYGAAGWYAALAPAQGLIGISMTTARSVSVVPTRASVPVFGTHPIAFAAPAGRHPPVVLDISTATVAANKVKVYDFHDKPIPEGWVVDAAGAPVTDAALALDYIFRRDVGGLTPVGGVEAMSSHKGYGLAMMVQALCGALAGAAFGPVRALSQASGDPDNIGHFFLAIRPEAFRPDGGFEAEMEEMVEVLHAACPADPDRPVLVPGDPERACREVRLREGVPIPPVLAEKIRGVCKRSGAAYLLEG